MDGDQKTEGGLEMEHKIIESQRTGETWKIKCSCGWFIISDRYICEGAHADHATPAPQLGEEPNPKWWDDASYAAHQAKGCSPTQDEMCIGCNHHLPGRAWVCALPTGSPLAACPLQR